MSVVFPDAEGVVVGYLNTVLAGDTARAYTRVPQARPSRFVRVILTGSQTRSVAHRDAQVTVECWDEAGGPEAAALADVVYDALTVLEVPGAHVPQGPDGWLGGPYSLPDPDTGTPRYVMTVIVRLRREA